MFQFISEKNHNASFMPINLVSIFMPIKEVWKLSVFVGGKRSIGNKPDKI